MFNSKHSPPLTFNKSVFTYLRAPISYQASYFRGLHLRMKTSSYKPTNQVQLCPITSFYFKLNCYFFLTVNQFKALPLQSVSSVNMSLTVSFTLFFFIAGGIEGIRRSSASKTSRHTTNALCCSLNLFPGGIRKHNIRNLKNTALTPALSIQVFCYQFCLINICLMLIFC